MHNAIDWNRLTNFKDINVKNVNKCAIAVTLIITIYSNCSGQSFPKNYGKIQTKLFITSTQNKRLVVAFGGSEGGNTFANEQTEDVRLEFLARGFSFLSIGYFGDKGLPKKLDRISLDAIYDTIQSVSRQLKIDSNKIFLIGASRGAELALNLASRYSFSGVIALVPPNVSFPEINKKASTSSWTYHNKEVPYIRLQYDSIMKNGFLKTVETQISNKPQIESSSIKVENIKGFILLTSGKSDELWPSEQMCNNIVIRLKENNFKYNYKHVSFTGGHQPSKHWNMVYKFIDEHVLQSQTK